MIKQQVKRYRLYKHGTTEKIDLSISERDGDFVRYEDYESLQREVERLRLREAKAVRLLTETAYTTDQDLEKFEEWIMERDEWLAYVDRKALTEAFAELDNDAPSRPS